MSGTRPSKPRKANHLNIHGKRVYKPSFYLLLEQVNKDNKNKRRSKC